jgi:hypothetical protein
MKTSILAICAVAVALLGLSGCAENPGEDGYRYEHGDRIAPDGKRDVGWCLAHPNNEHCRSVADSQ